MTKTHHRLHTQTMSAAVKAITDEILATQGSWPLSLEVCSVEVMMTITREELGDVIIPLASRILRCAQQIQAPQKRILIALAGSGAAGKSTFTALLSSLINMISKCANMCEVVGLDAFHYRNVELEEKQIRHLKGSPASFDVKSFKKTLQDLQRKDVMLVPQYCRDLHEPVPDRMYVSLQ